MARALADAGPAGHDAGLAAVIDAFRAAGLDPGRPHLSPGSTGSYEWPPATAARARATADDSAFLRPGRLTDAAMAAFAYERRLFDPAAGNRPDLRPDPTAAPDGPRFVVAWCHGAPGIALSRLRAGHPLDPQTAAALASTRDDLDLRQTVDAWDATPCHGIAGLSEALWIGGHTLDPLDVAGDSRNRPGRRVTVVMRRQPDGSVLTTKRFRPDLLAV